MTVLKYLIYNKKGQIQNQWICHKDAVFVNKESVFVKLELRLRLVLDSNEVLLAKLKLRL